MRWSRRSGTCSCVKDLPAAIHVLSLGNLHNPVAVSFSSYVYCYYSSEPDAPVGRGVDLTYDNHYKFYRNRTEAVAVDHSRTHLDGMRRRWEQHRDYRANVAHGTHRTDRHNRLYIGDRSRLGSGAPGGERRQL